MLSLSHIPSFQKPSVESLRENFKEYTRCAFNSRRPISVLTSVLAFKNVALSRPDFFSLFSFSVGAATSYSVQDQMKVKDLKKMENFFNTWKIPKGYHPHAASMLAAGSVGFFASCFISPFAVQSLVGLGIGLAVEHVINDAHKNQWISKDLATVAQKLNVIVTASLALQNSLTSISYTLLGGVFGLSLDALEKKVNSETES